MANIRNRTADPDNAVRVGFLLIDAWREEAALLEAAGKVVSAQRLRAMAAKAERLMRGAS